MCSMMSLGIVCNSSTFVVGKKTQLMKKKENRCHSFPDRLTVPGTVLEPNLDIKH